MSCVVYFVMICCMSHCLPCQNQTRPLLHYLYNYFDCSLLVGYDTYRYSSCERATAKSFRAYQYQWTVDE